MSYFVTFYSYKGGVGRTLALANVAWLLANHPSEPARVLAIDFDLGAPGLSQVFGVTGSHKSRGIVDYVTEYLEKAAIPNVSKFIHKTEYKNIDLLPAGRMGSGYQRRLEAIDWKEVYEGAFGYELIEKLKSDISAIRPEYDYVLVDSLTGYSDVGGICVNQLPDTLILLFRLNQQNLDGIRTVFSALRPRNEDEPARSVMPVITPSWPFLDEAAGKWINKAKKIFPGNRLLEISFDSSLSFGEKIVSESASKLPFTSKVLADYGVLTDQIRERNSSDPLTIWTNIRSSATRTFPDPAELFMRLLRRRPNTLEYWANLPMAFGYPFSKKSPSQAWKKLIAYIDQEVESGNKYALLGRARIREITEDHEPRIAANDDLDKALQIDPNFFEALLERASLAYHNDRYEEAIADLSSCLKLRPIESNRVHYLLAVSNLKIFRADEALEAIEAVIARDPEDLDNYMLRARALYLQGDYSSAFADVRKASRATVAGMPESFLSSQILAAMGQIVEATNELTRLSEILDIDSVGNLAEAYLAVEPNQTIELLKGRSREPEPTVRKLLIILAEIFRGDDLDEVASEIATIAEKPIKRSRWDLFEVVAMLRAKERAGTLSPKAIQLAYRAIHNAFKGRELVGIP